MIRPMSASATVSSTTISWSSSKDSTSTSAGFSTSALAACSISARMSAACSLIKVPHEADELRGGSSGRDGHLHDLAHPVRQLSALRHPVVNPFTLEFDAGGIGARIIGSHDLDRPAIASAFLLDHHDAIMRLLARTRAR